MPTAVQTKFATIIHLFISWVYKFLIHKICPVLAAFFKRVIISKAVIIRAVGGLNIGV